MQIITSLFCCPCAVTDHLLNKYLRSNTIWKFRSKYKSKKVFFFLGYRSKYQYVVSIRVYLAFDINFFFFVYISQYSRQELKHYHMHISMTECLQNNLFSLSSQSFKMHQILVNNHFFFLFLCYLVLKLHSKTGSYHHWKPQQKNHSSNWIKIKNLAKFYLSFFRYHSPFSHS